MKKLLSFGALLMALVCTTGVAAQQFGGLDKSPADIASFPTDYKVSEKTVRVIYSRPQLKGRALSELAPSGQVWRTGANEATEITFYKDVTVGDKAVKAGTYSLFSIPGSGEWTIILNKNLNQWGSYSYKEADDVARIKVPATTDSKSLEEFSIGFKEVDNGAHLVMGWDKTRVAVPITM